MEMQLYHPIQVDLRFQSTCRYGEYSLENLGNLEGIWRRNLDSHCLFEDWKKIMAVLDLLFETLDGFTKKAGLLHFDSLAYPFAQKNNHKPNIKGDDPIHSKGFP
jgi:hypothetical protein